MTRAELAAALALTSVIGCAWFASAQDAPAPSPAPPACNEQPAQDFLIRGNWKVLRSHTAEERRERQRLAQKAIQYRTEQYGHFPGFGSATANPHPPMHYAKGVRFAGLRTRLHEKILPALACVEAELARSCSATPYAPRRLSGIRDRNTYHNGEVSNHVYGIALDIDPNDNTCCGCVAPWNEHPLCQREVASIFERMVMPECWVTVFERYGFYWLGHDALQDTMHFEFLGEPERILAR